MRYHEFTKISLVLFMCLFIIPSINLVSAAEVNPRVNGKIAFASDRDGNYEIYVMNADGSGQIRLTNNNSKEEHPNWSPDGAKIAFSSNRDGNWEIYLMNDDGSGQTNLTNNYAHDERPSCSPDGTKILFNSYRDSNEEIYVMNSNGSGQTRLTNNTYLDERPIWSPDGKKLAFFSDRDGNREIYVMNSDGSGQTRLTNNNAADFGPSWSPDGTKITFVSERDGNREIYVMNADGSGQNRLTNNVGEVWYVSWSPDGTKIAFDAKRDGKHNVSTMNTDSSGQTKLTNNTTGQEGDSEPSWQSLYMTSFQQTGIGSDFSGNMLTADNVSYNANQLPVSLAWSPGTSHNFAWTSPLAVLADKRYVWSSSSGLSTEKSGTLIATSKGDSITANYVPQYYVKFETSSGGSVTPSSDWYSGSSAIGISATPSAGYSFSNWIVTGSVSVADAASKNTTLSINGSGSVTANFTVASFTISASAGSGGSISPSGSVAVNYGANQSFTITPNTGHNIAEVLIDGISGETLGSYTFTNIAANHTITASFAPSSTAPSTTTSTTSTPPSATSNAKKTNWGLIIGIIAVAVIFFIILLVVLRKRKSKEQS